MTKNFALASLWLASFFVFQSCKTTKTPSQDTGKLATVITEPVPEIATGRKAMPKHLNAKAKIDYKDREQSFSGIVNIRNTRDSLIWISIIPALGIEAVRIIINPDSMVFMNRLEREATIIRLKKNPVIGNAKTDFDLIQQIVLNDYYPFSKYERNQEVDSSISYAAKNKKYEIKHSLLPPKFLVNSTELRRNADKKRVLLSENSRIENINGLYFPLNRTFIAKLDDILPLNDFTLMLDYQKAEFGHLRPNMPSDIPQGYKRIIQE